MMSSRSLLQHVLRALLITIIFLFPFLGPLPLALIPVVMGSWIAYEGVDRGIAAGSVIVLVTGELFWGFDLGVFSLSYALTVLIALIAGAMFSLSPWRAARGWHATDVLRALITAAFFAMIMILFSVGIESWIYDRGMAVERISIVYFPALWRIPVYALIILALLRRIDVPWRQPIQFG